MCKTERPPETRLRLHLQPWCRPSAHGGAGLQGTLAAGSPDMTPALPGSLRHPHPPMSPASPPLRQGPSQALPQGYHRARAGKISGAQSKPLQVGREGKAEDKLLRKLRNDTACPRTQLGCSHPARVGSLGRLTKMSLQRLTSSLLFMY